MVPAYITDIPALFLMGLWIITWFFFAVVGRNSNRGLPLHQHLVRYSTVVFISITFFYWTAFSETGSLAGYLGGSGLLKDIGMFLSILGALGMIFSRWELRELTVAEIVFAKSEVPVNTGPYRYFKHPMYLGLFLVLISSCILYPNFIALFFMALAWFFVEKKKEVEEYRFA